MASGNIDDLDPPPAYTVEDDKPPDYSDRDRAYSDNMTTVAFSRQTALDTKDQLCPHGFESCEYYIMRDRLICHHDSASGKTIVWAKGDPEDDIIRRVDELYSRMITFSDYGDENSTRVALYNESCSAIKVLETLLVARPPIYGKYD